MGGIVDRSNFTQRVHVDSYAGGVMQPSPGLTAEWRATLGPPDTPEQFNPERVVQA